MWYVSVLDDHDTHTMSAAPAALLDDRLEEGVGRLCIGMREPKMSQSVPQNIKATT